MTVECVGAPSEGQCEGRTNRTAAKPRRAAAGAAGWVYFGGTHWEEVIKLRNLQALVGRHVRSAFEKCAKCHNDRAAVRGYFEVKT